MRFGRRLAWGWSNRSKINQLKFSKNSHPLYQPIYLPAKVLVEDEWILWAVERWRGCHLWRSTACTPHRPWVQALLIVFLGGDLFGDYLAKKSQEYVEAYKSTKISCDYLRYSTEKHLVYIYIYVRKYIYKFLNVIYIYILPSIFSDESFDISAADIWMHDLKGQSFPRKIHGKTWKIFGYMFANHYCNDYIPQCHNVITMPEITCTLFDHWKILVKSYMQIWCDSWPLEKTKNHLEVEELKNLIG